MYPLLIFLNAVFSSLGILASPYSVDISKSTQMLKQKERGFFIVSIKIEPGAQLNQEAPIKLVLEKNLMLQFAKTTMNKADLAKEEANAFQFQIPFQAQTIGKHVIKSELHFFLCRADACNAFKEILSLSVDVR
jgi:hypothetical protein